MNQIYLIILIKFIFILLMLMNQTSNSEKLRGLINNIIAAQNRVVLGQSKNQLKSFLEQFSTSNQSLMIVQQFLAFCIRYKRLNAILYLLNQNGQLSNLLPNQLDQITKKYILATPQASKLDEQQAKQVRILLTKRVLQDQAFMSLVISECRNDQTICLKFLKLISQYYKERKPIGNVTQLVVLCINVVKIKDQISNNLVSNALSILNFIGQSNQDIRKVILPAIVSQALQIYKSGKMEKDSLQALNSYLKQTNKLKQSQGFIQNICQVLKNKIKQKHKYLKTQKQLIMSREQSEQVVEFLRICFNLVRESSSMIEEKGRNKGRNKNVSTNDTEMKDNYSDLMEICQQSLLIINQSVVLNIIQLSDMKMQGLQHLFLSQCLINCVSYSFKKSQSDKNSKQLQIISYILFWLQNININQKNNIRISLNLQPQNVNRLNSQPPISLLGDFIRKSIQSQFQYEFNKQLMRSVCNLVCFLAHVLDQTFNPVKSKQFVMNTIKMLLNLNQSCQKQYRQFLVYKILKIITIYSKQLLKNNQFLKDVLQKKLLQKIFTYKQFLTYLNQQNVLSEQFYCKLHKKLQQPQILEAQPNDIQFIFDILVYHNKQKMQASTLGWEWSAYLSSSGKKIYGKEWNSINDKQLRNIKDTKMSNYYLQFGQDINKIDSFSTRKY